MEEQKTLFNQTDSESTEGSNIETFLKRAFMYLEDSNWEKADEYFEKVLDIDPENGKAYIGKLMAELKIKKESEFANCEKSFNDSLNYQKAVRFCDERTALFLKNCSEESAKKEIYNKAVSIMKKANSADQYKSAADLFKKIQGFNDADDLLNQCIEKAKQCIQDDKKFRLKGIIKQCLGCILIIAGIVMAVSGFSYKESYKSSSARAKQAISDYRGDGRDYSSLIDQKAGAKAAEGFGGVIILIVGIVVFVRGRGDYKKYRAAVENETKFNLSSNHKKD